MKKEVLALLGLAVLLSTAACAKKVVAQRPPDPTPVASAPAPTPPPFAQRNTPPAATPTPAPTAAVPRVMTETERIDLNTRLARLVDALFDYDKSTIRADA